MEFNQILLLLNIALQFNGRAQITITQIDAEDHDFDVHTVLIVKSVSKDEYEIQYQDLTCDPSPVTLRLNKDYFLVYTKEVMKVDCIKDNVTISIDRILFDESLYHVGSIMKKITSEFWND